MDFATAINMGTKCLGLILVFLFLSPTIAFLASQMEGKRNLAQKVNTSLTNCSFRTHFDFKLLEVRYVGFAGECCNCMHITLSRLILLKSAFEEFLKIYIYIY